MRRMRRATLLLMLTLISRGESIVQLTSPCPSSRCLGWLYGFPCYQAVDPVTAVREALIGTVVAQDAAVEQIIDAVASWHADAIGGERRPLVIVLTGPTGVGKTATAHAVAKALMPAGGHISFNGASLGSTHDTALLSERVIDGVAQGLYECNGAVVVTFDEAQKVPGRVLDALTPLMHRTHPSLKYYNRVGGPPYELDGSRAVFIVVSDAGVAEVQDMVTAAASPLAGSGLGERLRRSLTEAWQSDGLNFGSLAHVVVPFLPFDQRGVQALLEVNLRNWEAQQHRHWDEVRIANVTMVAAALSDPAFVTYGGADAIIEETASEVDSGGAAILCVDAEGRAAHCSDGQAHGGGGVLIPRALPCLDHAARAASASCAPCTVRTVFRATDGARGVLEHSEGPLRRLMSAARRLQLYFTSMPADALPSEIAHLSHDDVRARWPAALKATPTAWTLHSVVPDARVSARTRLVLGIECSSTSDAALAKDVQLTATLCRLQAQLISVDDGAWGHTSAAWIARNVDPALYRWREWCVTQRQSVVGQHA